MKSAATIRATRRSSLSLSRVELRDRRQARGRTALRADLAGIMDKASAPLIEVAQMVDYKGTIWATWDRWRRWAHCRVSNVAAWRAARPGHKTRRLERASAEGDLARYVIRSNECCRNYERHSLPLVEQRVRHGAKFTVQLAQIQPGRVSARRSNRRTQFREWKPARLRVFTQQERLIAIAEALVPRTYQPVVVLEAEA